MKKALVTGANGFVGNALVRELIANDIEVIAVVRENRGSLPQNTRVIECELKDSLTLPELILDRDIDIFYHIAWDGSAGAKRTDTALQLLNVQWTIDCLRTAKAMGCPRFVCAGSLMEREAAAVTSAYGYKPGKSYTKGSGIYGSAKLAAHNMCVPIAADLDIELIWTIITNIYGAGEVSPRFVNSTIRKIINNEPLEFTSGTQNYDFVYIDDAARAFRMIGESGKPFCDYVIGSSNAKSLKEFVLEMKSAIAPDREFKFGNVPFDGMNLPLDAYDCSLTEKDTGFKAEISFGEGVKKTMEWMAKENNAKI